MIAPTWESEDGTVTLYLADCLTVLPTLPAGSVDAVVTDPPFAFTGGMSFGRSSMADDQFFAHWWRDICTHLDRIAKDNAEGFIWCDWRTAATIARGFYGGQNYGMYLAQMLFHYREMPGQGQPFRSSVDMIAYVRGSKATGQRIANTTHNWISRYWYYGKHVYHPTEKDTEITKQLLEWCSDKGAFVLDSFMGSGTTGVACVQTGRRFIGIEIEPTYFEIAKRRIIEAQMQLRLPLSND